MPSLEKMDAFFAARVQGYDEHMLKNVEGCAEGYSLMADLVEDGSWDILDLGCGTGLELDALFARYPHLAVTAIDLCMPMLERLFQKHPMKNLTLICGDYFEGNLGKEIYDCALSFESLHHFAPQKKTALYGRILDALKPGGLYIECDYMVDTPEEEAFFFAEYERLKKEQGLAEGYYHFDIPCTVAHQKSMLEEAGFCQITEHFKKGNTVLLSAKKPPKD